MKEQEAAFAELLKQSSTKKNEKLTGDPRDPGDPGNTGNTDVVPLEERLIAPYTANKEATDYAIKLGLGPEILQLIAGSGPDGKPTKSDIKSSRYLSINK